MPTFSNVHAELDNHELHPPRDFSLADTDTFLAKNPLGDIQWHHTFWQRPILGFANASFPPLTLSHGDRYILLGSTNIDTSMDTSIWVDTSMDGTAINNTIDTDNDIHPAWGNVALGDIVEYYRYNNKEQPVFAWRPIEPQPGYQVFNLANKQTYCYTGTTWQVATASAPAPQPAQYTGTYAQLATKAAQQELIAGARYWVSDRNMILTAATPSAFAIDADYTQALPAHGFVDLNGASGSISSVMVNGQELLPTPVAFDTSIAETVSMLADLIGNGSETHGFSALSLANRLYILDIGARGTGPNGTAIVVTTSGLAATSQPLARGADIGSRWFKAKYRFADDWMAEMSDNQGNVVRCEASFVDAIGINPYQVFPWGYNTVSNNCVNNALLVCFPQDGVVNGNILDFDSLLLGTVKDGSMLVNNHIGQGTWLQMELSDACRFARNTVLQSFCNLSLSGGQIFKNSWALCEIEGLGATVDAITLNDFNGCNILLNGSETNIYCNEMEQTQLTAADAHFTLARNKASLTTIDVTNAGTTGQLMLQNNQLGPGTNLGLQRALGNFKNNRIDNATITAHDSHTDFEGNDLLQFCTLNLTNYTGSEFMANSISAATLNLEDASCKFAYNQVGSSVVNLLRHGNADCIQNVFTNSTITSNDSGSGINNNHIDFSTVKLSNTNGEFSGNIATYYSTYDLDGYLGVRVLLCELLKSSTLIANANTEEQGRILLNEITTLNISNSSAILYLANLRFPYAAIKVSTSQVSCISNIQESTISYLTEIELGGVLDLDQDTLRCGGVYFITNSGTLSSLTIGNRLPKEFILRPLGTANITIDTTSTNIKVANGISLGMLQGSLMHYVKIKQDSGTLIITEAFTS